MSLRGKVYVAGHRGMVGSAIVRVLEKTGYQNIVSRTHKELDLTDQQAVRSFFQSVCPEQVYIAAARARRDSCEQNLSSRVYLSKFDD